MSLTRVCVCRKGVRSSVSLCLSLERKQQSAALTQLLLKDAQLVLQPANMAHLCFQLLLIHS